MTISFLQVTELESEQKRFLNTLNEYLWGENYTAQSLDIRSGSTDQIFEKIKPILIKKQEPILLKINLNIQENSILQDTLYNFLLTLYNYEDKVFLSHKYVYQYFIEKREKIQIDLIEELKKIEKDDKSITYKKEVFNLLESYFQEKNNTNTSDNLKDIFKLPTIILNLYNKIIQIEKTRKGMYDFNAIKSGIGDFVKNSKEFIEKVENITKKKLDDLKNLHKNIEDIQKKYNDNLQILVNKENQENEREKASDAISKLIEEFFKTAKELVKKYRDILNEINLEKDAIKIFASNIKNFTLYVRLYPQAAQILYPIVITNTIPLQNKLLQTHHGSNKVEISFRNNIALYTKECQWFDLYSTLFYFLSNLNHTIDVIIGEYRIENCLFKTPPLFVNSFTPIQFFDINLISTIEDLGEIKKIHSYEIK